MRGISCQPKQTLNFLFKIERLLKLHLTTISKCLCVNPCTNPPYALNKFPQIDKKNNVNISSTYRICNGHLKVLKRRTRKGSQSRSHGINYQTLYQHNTNWPQTDDQQTTKLNTIDVKVENNLAEMSIMKPLACMAPCSHRQFVVTSNSHFRMLP